MQNGALGDESSGTAQRVDRKCGHGDFSAPGKGQTLGFSWPSEPD